MLDEPLVPLPDKGRVFRAERRVRLADAAPSQRMRFDAFARFLQDIGNDDTADSGLDERGGGVWVVRRAVVDVVVPPRWNEWLELATWCAGTGGRWAERRLAIRGEHGGHVETSTLWVHLHPEKLVPSRLPEAFLEIYGEAAGGRRISASHVLGPPPGWRNGPLPATGPGPSERVAWPLRAVDYDMMRHVNNAAYWAAIEELLAVTPGQGPHPRRGTIVRAILEYGPGIAPGAKVHLLVERAPTSLDVWFTVDDKIAATARVFDL